jgi:hypothetical protein
MAHGFEEAKKTRSVLVVFEVSFVSDCGHPSHHRALIVSGQKQLYRSVDVEWVVGAQQISDIAAERRYPHRIVPIESVREIDEGTAIGGGTNWRNGDQSSLPTRPVTTPFR